MADTSTDFELEWASDRAAVAAVCRRLAAALERDERVRVRSDDASATVSVPAHVAAALRIDHDADAAPPVTELALELEWDDGSSLSVAEVASDGPTSGGPEPAPDADDSAASDDVAVITPQEGVPGDEPRPSEAATAVVPPEAVVREHRSRGSEPGDDSTPTGDTDRTEPTERTSRFEVYEDRAGEWRWRLVHWNGNIIADSGEGYASKYNAKRAARGVMRAAPTARIEELDDD